MTDILADGCYPEHNSEMSWCELFVSGRQKYPRFSGIDDLVPIEEMAKFMRISRKYLADARFRDPALPYLRFGRFIYLSKVQVAWWMNEVQALTPDNYFLERRRRMANGIGPAFSLRGTEFETAVEETTDTDD